MINRLNNISKSAGIQEPIKILISSDVPNETLFIDTTI